MKDPKRGQNISFRETIGKHYDPTESGIVDDFTNPYIGKVYKDGWTDNFRSSEILSMGVGNMVDDAGAYMLKADPDFFEHIVDRMRGIRGRNFGRGNDFTDDVLELGATNTLSEPAVLQTRISMKAKSQRDSSKSEQKTLSIWSTVERAKSLWVEARSETSSR